MLLNFYVNNLRKTKFFFNISNSNNNDFFTKLEFYLLKIRCKINKVTENIKKKFL